MLTRRSQRAAMVKAVVAIVVLLVLMWVVWRVLLDVKPAPPPRVKVGTRAS
jgi:glucose dehydrogenase